MLKRTITYENLFTNETVTEDHYFHISKADMVEMEMEEHKNTYKAKDGKEYTGAQAKLQRIVDSEDGKAIIEVVKDFIRRAYGKRDGNRFIRTQEIWDEFASTEAFSQLLWELTTDAGKASEFINGIFPSNMDQIAEEIRKEAEKAAQTNGAPAEDPTGLTKESTPRVLTRSEVEAMDSDELKSGLATGRYKLS